jgi:hypothetical protein
VNCSEETLVAFLAGDLAPDEARSFDEHLISCESCWTAVQEDRRARLLLERAQQPLPDGLADRVSLAIELAASERAESAPSARRHRLSPLGRARPKTDARTRRMALTIGGIAACAALGLGLGFGLGGSPAGEPMQISALANLAEHLGQNSEMPARPLVADGQRMLVRAMRFEGVPVVVATSEQPFPMARASELVAGSSSDTWMATMGEMGAYCVNRSRGGKSMLVIAHMPAAELPMVAARLRLI